MDSTIIQVLENFGRHVDIVLQEVNECCVDPAAPPAAELSGLVACAYTLLQHGLRSPAAGFWPFVAQLVDRNTVLAVEQLASTGDERGRAWLLLAVGDRTLEFCVTSLLHHDQLCGRYYRSTALVRCPSLLKRVVLHAARLCATVPVLTLHSPAPAAITPAAPEPVEWRRCVLTPPSSMLSPASRHRTRSTTPIPSILVDRASPRSSSSTPRHVAAGHKLRRASTPVVAAAVDAVLALPSVSVVRRTSGSSDATIVLAEETADVGGSVLLSPSDSGVISPGAAVDSSSSVVSLPPVVAQQLQLRRAAGSAAAAVVRRRLRLRGAAAPPSKRATWAGTPDEQAVVQAALEALGQRGAPEGSEDPPRAVGSNAEVSARPSPPSSSSSASVKCLPRPSGKQQPLPKVLQFIHVRGKTAAGRLPLPKPLLNGKLVASSVSEAAEDIVGTLEQEVGDGVEERRCQRTAWTDRGCMLPLDCGDGHLTQLLTSFLQSGEHLHSNLGFRVSVDAGGGPARWTPGLLVLTTHRALLLRRHKSSSGVLVDQPVSAVDAGGAASLRLTAVYQYASIAVIQMSFHRQTVRFLPPSDSCWLQLGDGAAVSQLVGRLVRAAAAAGGDHICPTVVDSQMPCQYSAQLTVEEDSQYEVVYASLVYFADDGVTSAAAQLTGRLAYRTDSIQQWSAAFCVLRDEELCLYTSPRAGPGDPPTGPADLLWPLSNGCTVSRLLDGCELVLCVTHGSRQLQLRFTDPVATAVWLAAVRTATAQQIRWRAPVARCLLLTRSRLYIVPDALACRPSAAPAPLTSTPQRPAQHAGGTLFMRTDSDKWTPNRGRHDQLPVMAAPLATLDDISVHRETAAVVLEFIACDALESTGTWPILFTSREELDRFVSCLQHVYRDLQQMSLTVENEASSYSQTLMRAAQHIRSQWDFTHCTD